VPEGREFTELTIPRLRRLRELCDANGSQADPSGAAGLWILRTPVSQMAGRCTGRRSDVCGADRSGYALAEVLQRTGMHLDRMGAVLFTSATGKRLFLKR